ncbi:alpha/beta hydrolase [Aeromicrobium sp.]|uniref:alpha/beta hydrolase n=1 Tax=Aeromicrobium sp. TaxID=1871063 RepID=UPI0028ABEAE7|nr:alpha/beta hydrolase [Aeromicrobium sp.]
MQTWSADILGDPYERLTIDLGDDPDGEGSITATLVRRQHEGQPRAAVIYVHGFSDYFFQTELAEFYAERGFAFYSLDLRKCGRSLAPGHTPHYVSDLALYDAELDEALRIVRSEVPDAPIVLSAHSTGGLILPLWLDRMNLAPGGTRAHGVAGLVLNSPWFDLQGAAWMRTVGTEFIRAVSKVRPREAMKLPSTDSYGVSLHHQHGGAWDYDIAWKPLEGFPVTFGWMTAVRRGHAHLHRGLDIGVPSLVLRSHRTWFSRKHHPNTDTSDAVLDVRQIARWAGCLGGDVTSLQVRDARHDVYLSNDEPRAEAYRLTSEWLERWIP